MRRIKPYSVFLLIPLILFQAVAPAQELPRLPDADNIWTGSLPNGVHYYIVRNSGQTGMVDIALVQKVGKADETLRDKGTATVNARAALSDLPHFSPGSPFSYLNGKSIHPSSGGYVRTGEDATVYRFENLVQARKADIVDSTLLFVFDIISREGLGMKESYTPDKQAIIVAGDIEPDAIRGKMDILSMFISRKESRSGERSYSWQDSGKAAVRLGRSGRFANVTAEYAAPRTSYEEMSTILPLVTSRYALQLEIAVRKRLEAALAEAMLPYASIEYSYSGSAESPGDEKVRIGIVTDDDHLEKAAEILGGTLAGLDRDGVSPDEFRAIENEFMLKVADSHGLELEENARAVDKCVSAFLYGSSLASDKSSSAFFSRKDMDSGTSAKLFNNFISALLDKDINLTLECRSRGDVLSEEGLARAFRSSWESGTGTEFRCCIADSSSLRKSSNKTKLKQSIAEPLTGGESWTFSNGIKVIFKKVGDNGHFSYSWLVKGGYSYMQGLKQGERAYLGDMLGTFRVGDLSGREFMNMLNANGISMETSVSLSEMSISGCARSSGLPLLMKSLISLSSQRSIDRDAFELLRLRASGGMVADDRLRAGLDSLMTPDVSMSGFRRAVYLSDNFPERARRYYDDSFSRMNDGVLIIVGDLDAETVIRQLTQYLGAFRTEKAYAFRSKSPDAALKGRKTLYESGPDAAVGVRLSAAINYTAENFMAANIAAIFMEDAVAKTVAREGWTVTTDSRIQMFPEESLVMDFILRQADADGMPATMVCEDSADAVLESVRRAIEQAGENGIGADDLRVGKTMLLNSYNTWKNDPKTLTRILVLRYSYGKDLLSDFSNKIAAVSVRNVNPVMSSLSRGGIAEYVVRKDMQAEFRETVPQDMEMPYIPEMRPVEGSFYYPYDGHAVPPDTLDLSDLGVPYGIGKGILPDTAAGEDSGTESPEDLTPEEEDYAPAAEGPDSVPPVAGDDDAENPDSVPLIAEESTAEEDQESVPPVAEENPEERNNISESGICPEEHSER